jgi:hypothetical protein
LLVPAAISLAIFSWLLTLHPEAAGRVYAGSTVPDENAAPEEESEDSFASELPVAPRYWCVEPQSCKPSQFRFCANPPAQSNFTGDT